MRNPLTLVLVIAAAVGALALGAGRARADIPPPDLCTSPGQPCQNAGPQYDSPGTCVATTCTKQVLGPDGGRMPMTYDCNLCAANGGAGGGGAGGGGAGGAGGSTSHPSSGSSGCALAPTGSDGAGAAVLLMGLLVVTARRRKSIG
jgi:MYXO-CTERM domain-containing protein